MLSLYITIPLVTAFALLQDVLLSRVSLLGARPDLLFLAVVCWALLRGSAEGVVWAFIGGLVLDLFSGGPMGGLTLAYVVVAFLAGRQWGRELGSAAFQSLLLGLGLCFLFHVLLLLVLTWAGHPVAWAHNLAAVAAPSAVLNGVLAPFAHWVLRWLDRRTRPEGLVFDVRQPRYRSR
jgi:rod shape-determining protein MreD